MIRVISSRCFIFILGENRANYRNGITADRELEQFFPLYTPFSPSPPRWKRLHPSIRENVNRRTNAFNVRQIELTYTALCADCSRNCEALRFVRRFGGKVGAGFQKAWDRWVNGGKGRVYANMRAHDRVEARSECVPNDRQTASKSLDRRKVPFLRYDNIDRRPMVRRLNYYVARRTRCA